MKRVSLTLTVLLLAAALALPPAASADGTPPEAWVKPLMPVQYRVPNFNISYEAKSYDDPLAYVELWYRYSVDLCTYTPWTFHARDWTCAGEYDCGATFAFTAPVQAYYEVIMLAYDQGGRVEDQDWNDEDDWVYVDFSNPIIGWPPNPAPGAVVKGTITVGTYFNDSWALVGAAIWDETWGSFFKVWTGWPPCEEDWDAPPFQPDEQQPQAKPEALGPKEKVNPRMAGRLCGTPPAGGVQALGSAGLPAGTYSTLWDTTTVPDGPVEICFYAEDYGDDNGEFWGGNYTYRCMTVIVNNYTALEPQLLSATATGAASGSAAGTSAWTVTFLGVAPPPAGGNDFEVGPDRKAPEKRSPASLNGVSLGVEVKVEGAGGFVQTGRVGIAPDRRWTYSLSLPEGDYTAYFRTRTDYGAVSAWVPFAFNSAHLPARLTLLAQGYDGYTGARDTYINQWQPASNFYLQKLFKVRSFAAKKGLSQFDLAPLAGIQAGQVARAALVFWVDGQTNPQPMTLWAYPLIQAWDPATVNWQFAAPGVPWTLPGAGASPDDYLTEPSASTDLVVGRWAILDVTDFVKGWLGGTLPQNGVLLMGSSAGAVRYTLATSAPTQPGYHPILLVEWNP